MGLLEFKIWGYGFGVKRLGLRGFELQCRVLKLRVEGYKV